MTTNFDLTCRYLDKIILDILYKSAQAVAEKETEQQLGTGVNSDRRVSAPEELGSEGGAPRVNLEIKRRLKDLQRSHLMQAHDALMTVLGEIKDTVQVSKPKQGPSNDAANKIQSLKCSLFSSPLYCS